MLAIIAGLDLQRWRPYIVTHLPAYQETGVPVDCILYICYLGHGYSRLLSPASRALPVYMYIWSYVMRDPPAVTVIHDPPQDHHNHEKITKMFI